MPLITPEGYALGTICVMDFVPRKLTIEQQETLRRLAQQLVSLLEHRRRIIELDEAMRALDKAHRELASQKDISDKLLDRILPATISEELKATGKVEPRYYPSATILFADIQEFTRFAERLEPRTLIGLLDHYFAAFDEVVRVHGVEKIKTVGDAYLAVAGVPEVDRLHVLRVCLAALGMLEVMKRIQAERSRLRLPFFELRIGIHTGAVIAGTIGMQRFTFDIWGDAVNVAARIESEGETGRILVSEQVYHHVKAYFDATERGSVELKNKGSLQLYYLDRLKPEFSSDQAGFRANAKLGELINPKVLPTS
jgi:class 3 adenylate cyclase